ncbi:MAG: peptide-methionine (S)-S-oxide reductase MsrA [Myxococcales bacterium]|nr:peptide-methionine (S)-S-oxide reductase MsrA [Myxococcales bacterium]
MLLRRNLLALLATATLTAACGRAESAQRSSPPSPEPTPAAAKIEVGYFAGGCFSGVEHFLEALPGVIDVESGYMGGASESPTYDEVSTGASGHAEAVRVTYDPAKITYEAVARRFFEIHDPTEVDRQGPDIGHQYRSAVFVTGPEQRAVIDRLIGQLRTNGYAVATEVEEAGPFWLAEAYHQDYYERTHKVPYCHAPVPRFDGPQAP